MPKTPAAHPDTTSVLQAGRKSKSKGQKVSTCLFIKKTATFLEALLRRILLPLMGELLAVPAAVSVSKEEGGKGYCDGYQQGVSYILFLNEEAYLGSGY